MLLKLLIAISCFLVDGATSATSTQYLKTMTNTRPYTSLTTTIPYSTIPYTMTSTTTGYPKILYTSTTPHTTTSPHPTTTATPYPSTHTTTSTTTSYPRTTYTSTTPHTTTSPHPTTTTTPYTSTTYPTTSSTTSYPRTSYTSTTPPITTSSHPTTTAAPYPSTYTTTSTTNSYPRTSYTSTTPPTTTSPHPTTTAAPYQSTYTTTSTTTRYPRTSYTSTTPHTTTSPHSTTTTTPYASTTYPTTSSTTSYPTTSYTSTTPHTTTSLHPTTTTTPYPSTYTTTTTTTRYPSTYTSTTPHTTTSPHPTTTTTPYPSTTYTTTSTTTSYPRTSYTSTTSHTTTSPHPTTTNSHPSTTQAPITTSQPTSQYPTSNTTPHPPRPCDYPYESLGNKCVFVDPVLQATWDEAHYMCGRVGGGDLVILDSLDFYSELIQYIKTKGLTRHSYWVGGRGIIYKSKWEWSTGSDVRMGTPLWAISNYNWSSSIYEQEPVDFDKSLENCGYLDLQRYHYMDDDDCNDIKATICQMPTWKVSRQDTSEIKQDEPVQAAKVPKASPQGKMLLEYYSRDKEIQAEEGLEDSPLEKSSKISAPLDESLSGGCDYPYDLVGDRCVVVDPVLKATWDEARYLCGRSGGDLVVLDSMDFYGALLDYVEGYGLDLHDYWVGGIGSKSSGAWKWVSGSTILDGTPLWALLGSEDEGYNQEPIYFEESLSKCGYLDLERHHYMDDADCQELKAAICQLPTWAEDAGGQSSIPKLKEISSERAKELHAIARDKHI